MRIAVINGPNLNMLGKRNPEIYGNRSFSETLADLRRRFPETEILYFQSNSEGEIINRLQQAAADSTDGVVINPGAYAHYSYAIADAIADMEIPVVEVHISNIHAREEFRAKSVTARAARAAIAGCGRLGYALAIEYILNETPGTNVCGNNSFSA